jgi:hypothetical protein
MARHCPGSPNCVAESQEVCITLLFMGIDSEELNLILVIIQGGLRVENNPALCGHLNEDVGDFVALNFRNKYVSLVSYSIYFHKFLFLYCLPRVAYLA